MSEPEGEEKVYSLELFSFDDSTNELTRIKHNYSTPNGDNFYLGLGVVVTLRSLQANSLAEIYEHMENKRALLDYDVPQTSIYSVSQ